MMHGSIYVTMKTEGDMHERARSWINPCIIFFVISYALTTIATLIYMPHMAQAFRQYPFLFAFITLGMLGIANIPREIHRQKDGWAFVSSAASILFLTVLYAVGTFPNLVRNSCDPQASVTIYNACSSALSLKYLLTIVCIGMPFVVAYTATIYWIFRGKVRLDPMSY
jgi:cytochrome d ubiquinol oxidase subunit II